MSRILIVGGGIAGLSVAHALVQRGAADRHDIQVLEAAPRAGGNIRTDLIDGFLCEWGPNGFLDNVPATLELVHALGLDDRLLPSDDRARRRYIFRNGRLHKLPGGPIEFVTSGLLSWRGKLRIAGEPWAAKRPDGDETIHAFAARRIGREAADILIDSMVSGVFGGDARRLSLRACFPKMWDMETEHGGLFRALWARRKRRPKAKGEAIGSPLGRLTSFVGGSEDIVRALVVALGSRVRTGTPVERVEKGGRGYRVMLAGGEALDADAVLLAGGAAASSRIVSCLDPALSDALAQIPSAPMVVVCLGYRESKLPTPLDGFGFLVPRGEGPRILGALWDSSVYPNRAPAAFALIRVMLGGAHDVGAIDLDDEAVLSVVRSDLVRTMGLSADPDFIQIFRHPIGIPQYTVGHLDRLAAADARLAMLPGLFLAGNAYKGVAINACVADAPALADRLLDALPSPGRA